MAKKVKDRRLPIIVLMLLILFAAVGIIGYFMSGTSRTTVADGKVPPNIVSYPTIKTTVTSAADGELHTLDIELSVEYKPGTEKDIAHGMAYDKIHDTISKLDYQELRTDNSIAYIKQRVADDLAEITEADNISNIYISNIVIDYPNVIEIGALTEDELNNRLKGLFQNMK